jgi:SAM-dependent methyltransferase
VTGSAVNAGEARTARRGSLPPVSIHAWLRWDRTERMLPAHPARVLEIGCGLGSFGRLLASRYDYTGLEPDPTAHAEAVERVGDLGRVLDVRVEELPPGDFDLVCAFEVLEHLEDDLAALRAWQAQLRPGGSLLLSVPAGRDRFGPTDVKAGHFRRYDADDLRALLAEAGYADVAVRAYGFPVGYALELGRNLYASRRTGPASMAERTSASGRWLQPPEWAGLGMWALAWPWRLAQRPFGGRGTGLGARATFGSP